MAETTAVASVSDAGEALSAAAGGVRALAAGSGLLALSTRTRVRVLGEDRVRWLNGMVTNTVKDLVPGKHNYSFLLNAQGRIQGDTQVFARESELVLETDRAQVERVVAHLDRFIIMDDVELVPAVGDTAMELAGPGAAGMLASLGLPVPAPGEFVQVDGQEIVGEWSPLVPRYTLWVADAEAVRERLLAAGAVPVTAEAFEALRVAEGTPRYGVDITEKHLPQETGVGRALHFSKGCYLGQEIVERIRSRAQVHRGIRQFRLEGTRPTVPAPLLAGPAQAGELTSVADVDLGELRGIVGLGTVRLEHVERGEELRYEGGAARVLEAGVAAQHG